MDKRKRYRVERTNAGMWVVIDRHVTKVRMHNDVIDTFSSRKAARMRCRELNFENQSPEAERLAI
jgi:hypothetical protein